MSLMVDILKEGEERNGRNGNTLSLFSRRLEFDIRNEGFPLLTTKRVFWRGVVEELLWFLRGSSDTKELSDKNIHIWNGNSTREFLDSVGLRHIPTGSIGAGYGHQWRNFGGDVDGDRKGVDQLWTLLYELSHNPHGRRAVLSAWNPLQLHEAALPPCHVLYIFYIGKNGLSCQMTQRSADVAAGLPFNIASTSLLTTILAKVLNIPVDRVIIDVADAHIYEQHIDNAFVQIERECRPFPTLEITKDNSSLKDASIDMQIEWIESLTFEDFCLTGYDPHPTLRFEMIP